MLAPYSVVTADLGGDGDPDVASSEGAVVGVGPGTVTVGLNNGGVFVTSSYPVPFAARLRARDIDLDGDVDPFVGLTTLLNDGIGGFGSTSTVVSTTTLTDWLPGDYDGDGDLLSSWLSASGTLMRRVFRRDSSGSYTFLTAVAATPPGYVGVEFKFDTADMKANGIDDFV